MRILLDHCVPAAVIELLAEFDVMPARLLHWEQVGDGDLATLAERTGFTLLLTVDQNLPDQQNWEGRTLALIVLHSQSMPVISRFRRRIIQAINAARPGTITHIDMPKF